MIVQLEPADSNDDAEEVTDEPQADETVDSKRYGLCVSTSRYGKSFGIWDGQAGQVIERFCTRDEAINALACVIAGDN